MKAKKIGIIGANSLKGKEIIRSLIKNNYPFEDILALDLKLFEGKVLNIEKQRFYIKETKEDALKNLDIAFFVISAVAKEKWVKYLKENTSCYLINIDDTTNNPMLLKDYTVLEDSKIYNLPSSVSLAILYALRPLKELGKITRLIYTSMQSVSDLGIEAINEIENQYLDYVNYRMMTANILPLKHATKHYPLALNIIPQTSDISFETMQSKDEFIQTTEIKKILDDYNIEIFNTTLRVPLIRTDCISLYIELDKTIDIFDYIEKANNDPHLSFIDDPLNCEYPMPLTAEGNEKVQIGRIRLMKENAFLIYIVSDNLLKGTGVAAYQAVQMIDEKDDEVS